MDGGIGRPSGEMAKGVSSRGNRGRGTTGTKRSGSARGDSSRAGRRKDGNGTKVACFLIGFPACRPGGGKAVVVSVGNYRPVSSKGKCASFSGGD